MGLLATYLEDLQSSKQNFELRLSWISDALNQNTIFSRASGDLCLLDSKQFVQRHVAGKKCSSEKLHGMLCT